MATVHLELKKVVDNSYDIEIGSNLFEKLIEDLSQNNLGCSVNRYALITDSTVKALYGDRLYLLMKEKGYNVELFYFEAGEASKTRATKEMLEDSMLEKGFKRDSMIIALGGGVVTDIAGFVAGTFARGIPFVNYTTTLLGAADASVGGKTAVDTPLATNLIGLFYQPKKVYIDLATWNTLPKRQICSGLAETIKHACLADYDFFCYLEKNVSVLVESDTLDTAICEYIAMKNCQIKHSIVIHDEKEVSGLRECLNLGHTFGRAIETLSNYQLLHGEALAIGLALQAYICSYFGYIDENDFVRIVELLHKAKLPTTLPEHLDITMLADKLYTDKKVKSGQVHFVLQKGIGGIKSFGGKFSIPLSDEFIINTLASYNQA